MDINKIEKMLKEGKKENPELLQKVLKMTTEDILKLTPEEKVEISLLKAPNGYKLVYEETREPERYKYPLKETGKFTGEYLNFKARYFLIKIEETMK